MRRKYQQQQRQVQQEDYNDNVQVQQEQQKERNPIYHNSYSNSVVVVSTNNNSRLLIGGISSKGTTGTFVTYNLQLLITQWMICIYLLSSLSLFLLPSSLSTTTKTTTTLFVTGFMIQSKPTTLVNTFSVTTTSSSSPFAQRQHQQQQRLSTTFSFFTDFHKKGNSQSTKTTMQSKLLPPTTKGTVYSTKLYVASTLTEMSSSGQQQHQQQQEQEQHHNYHNQPNNAVVVTPAVPMSATTGVMTTSTTTTTPLQTQQQIQTQSQSQLDDPIEKILVDLRTNKNKNEIINLSILIMIGVVVVHQLFMFDADICRGWTVEERAVRLPSTIWWSYINTLTLHPIFTKACTSATVYTIGDYIAQRTEGTTLSEIDRVRILRSLIAGFIGHGPLSHYWYIYSEEFFTNMVHMTEWWSVLPKVFIDQTFWGPIWNSSYIVLIGCMKLDTIPTIFKDVRRSLIPLVVSGLKLWPLAHIVTYGLIPVENRLLWVDFVEIFWVTILATQASSLTTATTTTTTPIIDEPVLLANGEVHNTR